MSLKEKVTVLLKQAVETNECAGASLLVMKNGKEVFYTSAGYANTQLSIPIQRDSIFRLYSQTKPVTAAATMLLMERGKLNLFDVVEKYLPGFRNPMVWTTEGTVPAKRAPMVYDLLNMTAGLCYPDVDPVGKMTASIDTENKAQILNGNGMNTQELSNRYGQLPLAFHPGEHFRYSICADVLGAVIEQASGMRFGRFLKEELFEPLGMNDTGFWIPEEKRSRLVTCYERVNGSLKPYDDIYLSVGKYDTDPAFESGGAGLVSTINDYAAFAQMLLQMGTYNGKRILGRRTIHYMTMPQLSDTIAAEMWNGLQGHSFGKLMRVVTDPGQTMTLSSMGEYGWDGWLGTYFANFPGEKISILLMQNTTETGTGNLIRLARNIILADMLD